MERCPVSIEMLECKLTQEELVEAGSKLTQELNRRDTLKSELKTITDRTKGNVTACEGEIEKYRLMVSTQKTMRQVKCRTIYNDPVEGVKSLVRTDSGEVIREQAMTDRECEDLFINGLGPQTADDVNEFVFVNKKAIAIADREAEDFEPKGWKNVTPPLMAEKLVRECPSDKDLEANEYRVVSGENKHDDGMLYQLQKKNEVEEVAEQSEQTEAEEQNAPEPEQETDPFNGDADEAAKNENTDKDGE